MNWSMRSIRGIRRRTWPLVKELLGRTLPSLSATILCSACRVALMPFALSSCHDLASAWSICSRATFKPVLAFRLPNRAKYPTQVHRVDRQQSSNGHAEAREPVRA